MNYRHAFHAGNFADCMKHALLVWLLDALQRKPAPIFVLDTHAGAGAYSLASDPAERTGEWRAGIGRLLERTPEPLTRYVELVRRLGLYPGSPAITRALLRPGDRMACCELHPDDSAALRRWFARDRQVAVHHRDAWEAIGALLPAKERRGLVLIDPPYEHPREFDRLVAGLATGYDRFRTGVFAAWYPIKHRATSRTLFAALKQSGMRDIVAAELCLREPLDPGLLNGCGLIVINPPHRFEADALLIIEALRDQLSHEVGATATISRLVDE